MFEEIYKIDVEYGLMRFECPLSDISMPIPVYFIDYVMDEEENIIGAKFVAQLQQGDEEDEFDQSEQQEFILHPNEEFGFYYNYTVKDEFGERKPVSSVYVHIQLLEYDGEDEEEDESNEEEYAHGYGYGYGFGGDSEVKEKYGDMYSYGFADMNHFLYNEDEKDEIEES